MVNTLSKGCAIQLNKFQIVTEDSFTRDWAISKPNRFGSGQQIVHLTHFYAKPQKSTFLSVCRHAQGLEALLGFHNLKMKKPKRPKIKTKNQKLKSKITTNKRKA